ncbi:MAG: hypothetical protein M3Q45_02095, partial [Chloroflexota bacterium]|nr:hypothetical protein [Chloroflexota bacterium]
ITLWDETGQWKNMPEQLEQAIYGGLTPEQMSSLEKQKPVSFSGPQAAIAWGYEQGCFNDAVHAQNAYDELKRAKQPKNAEEMWALWCATVTQRVQEQQATLAEPELVF